MLFTEITDQQSQAISGGGQLVTNLYDQKLFFEQQNTLVGYSNAGGQFKTEANGSGWTPVYSQQWVQVGSEETLLSSTKTQVAGKGGVTNTYNTSFYDTSGNLLGGDPR